jgi:hypothetical protein
VLLLLPERMPPSCCSAVDDQDFNEHVVSRLDTLSDITNKYAI